MAISVIDDLPFIMYILMLLILLILGFAYGAIELLPLVIIPAIPLAIYVVLIWVRGND